MTQLTIAIAKGRLQAGTLELLANSGLCDTRDALSSRRLVIEDEPKAARLIFYCQSTRRKRIPRVSQPGILHELNRGSRYSSAVDDEPATPFRIAYTRPR